ncbi:MAG: TrkH family potassium uptake protein [Pseudomonadota bacterium]
MFDPRPIAFIIGVLLGILAVAMLIPAAVDLVAGHGEWQIFLASAALTAFIGGALVISCRTGWGGFSLRQAFIMTNLAWLVIVVFGALPFVFSELKMSLTDSFFEAMSGITTTGSTVIVGLDQAPPGILLWRAILQWLGGIGIIVMAIAILPVLQVGGMQLFRVEAFEADKVLPRAAQIAAGISIIYVFLTALATIVLWALGMSKLDAVAHAMTSIATGGFSTRDGSVGHFNSPAIDWCMSLFMVLGSLPFVLYLRAVRGNIGDLFRDSQVRVFFGVLAAAILLTAIWLWRQGFMEPIPALRYSTFNVISIMTGTGYATTDFGQWGGFALTVLFLLMFVGGCAGSTTCGIKIFRFQVLYATAKVQLKRLSQPNGVFVAQFNRRPIPDAAAASVMGFFFLFITSFALLAGALGFIGLDFRTSVSGAASAIANVGPGLSDIIGPAGTFAELPDEAKWLLSAGMLLGRLELFTVLVLFTRSFWRG